MKKLLSLMLALALILSLSIPAFAASDVPSVLYIDVAGAMNSQKTIDRVGLFLYSQSGQDLEDETMTHVSGTIYSYDISSVLDPYHWARYTIYYADGTHEYQANTTVFESGKNLFTATDGTWSVYEEAATPSVTNGSQNVTGKYVDGAESGTIYGLDISWGSMAFTYTDASKGTWNAETHRYEGAANAAWSWEEGANEITVTNHSNDGITVTPSYTKDTGYESASMAFGNAPLTLATADNGENGAAGTATNGTITVTPCGSVPAGTSGRIGQITLSIAGTDDSPTGGETTDEKAVITGVEVKVGDTTYQSGDTATLTSESEVTLIVKGTNLQNSNANTNQLFFAPNVALPVTSEYWKINTNGTEATISNCYSASILATLTTAYELLYTNDGGTTSTGSGVKILYQESTTDEKAVITGVEVKVGGTTYQSGTVTLNADSGGVTIIVKGTNLQNGIAETNLVRPTLSMVLPLISDSYNFNTAGTEATSVIPMGPVLKAQTTEYEIQYTNDGGTTWVGSGVKLLYEDSGGETTDDTAVITGVEVKVGDTTYQSGDTVTLTPDSGDVTLVVKGTNLLNGSMSANWVQYVPSTIFIVASGYVKFNEDGAEATLTFSPSDFAGYTTAYEIQYTNDAGATWNNSGVKILYDNGLTEAVITGVEIKVGDTTYQSGDTVTLNADSGDVTLIVKGRNLQNGSSSNRVKYCPGYAAVVADGYYFTFSDDGTEATQSFSPSEFATATTAFELQYTNEGSNYVGSGVKILYEA